VSSTDGARPWEARKAHDADLVSSRWLLLGIAGFFVLLLPTIADGLYFFGDERFYTDAAVRMLHRGDLLTPYYISDGLPHFNKPILAYWAVLSGFAVGGISFLTARLPFVLAGCGALALTYRLALIFFRGRKEALLASLILGSNGTLIAASTRATPDILLALFLLASLCGFSALLFGDQRTRANYLLAYGGAALAFESKGMLALVVLLYIFLYCAVRRPNGVGPRDLVDGRSIAIAGFLGLSWYLAAALQHGAPLWKDFIGDQVTDNLDEARVSHLENVAFLVGATLQHFLPWSLMVLLSAIPGSATIARFWRQHREKFLFALLWYALLVAIFCMSNRPRGRYLLPAYPLFAVLLAGLLTEIVRDRRSAIWVRRTSLVAIAVLAGVGGVLALLGAPIDVRLLIAGLVLVAANGALFFLALHRPSLEMVALGLAFFLLVAVHGGLVRPVFLATPERDMARVLLDRGVRGDVIATVDLPSHAASVLSLWSGGQLASKPQRDDVPWGDLERYPVILLSETARERYSFEGYRVTACGRLLPDFTAAEVWRLVSSRDKQAVMDGMATRYFVAIRESGG